MIKGKETAPQAHLPICGLGTPSAPAGVRHPSSTVFSILAEASGPATRPHPWV